MGILDAMEAEIDVYHAQSAKDALARKPLSIPAVMPAVPFQGATSWFSEITSGLTTDEQQSSVKVAASNAPSPALLSPSVQSGVHSWTFCVSSSRPTVTPHVVIGVTDADAEFSNTAGGRCWGIYLPNQKMVKTSDAHKIGAHGGGGLASTPLLSVEIVVNMEAGILTFVINGSILSTKKTQLPQVRGCSASPCSAR